jgi:hypothetical protein
MFLGNCVHHDGYSLLQLSYSLISWCLTALGKIVRSLIVSYVICTSSLLILWALIFKTPEIIKVRAAFAKKMAAAPETIWSAKMRHQHAQETQFWDGILVLVFSACEKEAK